MKTPLNILIVEDNADDADILLGELRHAGFDPTWKRVQTEADFLAEIKNRPDIIISDYSMPQFNGLRAARLSQESGLGIPFILTSGTVGEEVAVEAMKHGATDYMLKDRLVRLGSAVERALREAKDQRDLKKIEQQILLQTRALEAAANAILITDRQGNILSANTAFCTLTGYTAEEVRGRTPALLKSGMHGAAFYGQIWQTVCDGRIWRGEITNRRKDGTLYQEDMTVTPVRAADGAITHFIAIKQDITARKQAEARIREQAALLDQTQDAVLVRDLEHRILYWNKGAERIYGWTSAEVLGRFVHDTIYRGGDDFAAAMGKLHGDGSWSGELDHVTKDGTQLMVESRWTLLCDENGTPKSVLTVNTDVTERKKIEQQFLRAQRLESIGTLAGGIAHDLNNLLAPIVMGVDLLKQFGGNPRSLPVLENMARSAKRGTDLVRQVLTFARGVEGTRVALPILPIVREIESIAASTFPKNIVIRAVIAPDLWLVTADASQINQVLLNLCVNARDAMPEGGRLDIAAANVEIDEQYSIMDRGVASGRYVMIQVTDSGTGMPQSVIDHIFEPFFTTKEIGKGTGLGLSTVMGIVRSHGGFVNVYSEPGKGSVFKTYLPALPEGAGEIVPDPETESLPRGNGELILVVDDEASILEITQQTLDMFGYKVITAEDGAQAIGLYAMQREAIAVVITDMMMPVMDGPGLIAALRRINPEVGIIAASGLNANGNAVRAATAGVKHFLAKPYSAETMLKMMKTVLLEKNGPDAGRLPL